MLGNYLQAYLLNRDGKPREAVQLLVAHPQLLAGYPPANYVLAASALADNQPELALTYARHFNEKMPDEIAGKKLLAAIYQRNGNGARAIEILEPLGTNAHGQSASPAARRRLSQCRPSR